MITKGLAASDRLEHGVAAVLRLGVILSVTIILLGIGLMLVHHPEFESSIAAGREIVGGSYRFPHDLRGVLWGVVQLQGRSVVTLGLLVLMATPVARVALSLLLFARQRERAFCVMAGLVLFFLLISFLVGKAQ